MLVLKNNLENEINANLVVLKLCAFGRIYPSPISMGELFVIENGAREAYETCSQKINVLMFRGLF